MRKFHELTVRDVREETPDAVCVTFDVPEELADQYRYVQGQHLTLRREINGEDLRRSYSICSSVDEGRLTIVARHLPEGRFSSFVKDKLKPGDTVAVFPPMGHFYVDLDPENEKHYVAFAAGSGITPIMSIIKTTLEREPKSRFTLFYGNRTGDTTIFRSTISALKNRYMDRFSFYHFLSQQDLEVDFFRGRLDGEKVNAILDRLVPPDIIDEAFVCGPDTMIEDVSAALKARGLEDGRIHYERFTNEGQVAGDTGARRDRAERHAAASSEITVIIDGMEHAVPYEAAKGTVLEAAEAAGLEVPFSCRSGVCTTCRARVMDGTAEMDVNYGLEEDEVKAGYILTCQAVPTGDKLVISYDE